MTRGVFILPDGRAKAGGGYVWTGTDMSMLRTYYTDTDPDDFNLMVIAKTLNRTKAAVALRASRASLCMPRGARKKSKIAIENMGHSAKGKWSARPHPKGMLGKKHTPEALIVMSQSSKAMWANMSQEQIMASKRKAAETKTKNGTAYPGRPNATWKAGWREIGDKRVYYRSRWEANYARILEWMKAKGEVIEWAHEPDTFWFDGVKRGCVSYLPDFKVRFRDDKIEYHEVKGWMDDRSKTKIRRMAKYHPKVVLRVIDTRAYKTLKRQMAGLIPDWE